MQINILWKKEGTNIKHVLQTKWGDQILSSLLACFCSKMEINLFPGAHHPFPRLSVICRIFFLIEKKKLLAFFFFFEEAKTEGHVGAGSVESHWVAPLFYDGKRVISHFPGGGQWRTGLAGAGFPCVQRSGTSKPRASWDLSPFSLRFWS